MITWLMMKLPPWAQWAVFALFCAWAVALVVSWAIMNIELLGVIDALGRAAGHRAYLQSLDH